MKAYLHQERLRREKLEAELDKAREEIVQLHAYIDKLTRQLQRALDRAESPEGKKEKSRKPPSGRAKEDEKQRGGSARARSGSRSRKRSEDGVYVKKY